MEKKIYSSWAFSENEREKAHINREIHKELKEKYKIYRNDSKIILEDGKDINFDDYDVIIGRKACYHHGEYKVYKNAPNLSELELALLCDGGNLCFGYRTMGSNGFYIFED